MQSEKVTKDRAPMGCIQEFVTNEDPVEISPQIIGQKENISFDHNHHNELAIEKVNDA